jgi:hypothetical protein
MTRVKQASQKVDNRIVAVRQNGQFIQGGSVNIWRGVGGVFGQHYCRNVKNNNRQSEHTHRVHPHFKVSQLNGHILLNAIYTID